MLVQSGEKLSALQETFTETPTQVFCFEFWEIFKNIFFCRAPPVAASEHLWQPCFGLYFCFFRCSMQRSETIAAFLSLLRSGVVTLWTILLQSFAFALAFFMPQLTCSYSHKNIKWLWKTKVWQMECRIYFLEGLNIKKSWLMLTSSCTCSDFLKWYPA